MYQALWAENTDFDEVLISPVMIQDHMPDKVLEALEKVSKYDTGLFFSLFEGAMYLSISVSLTKKNC